MSMDNSIGGGVSVQAPVDSSAGDVDKAGSIKSNAFNRSVSVESNVESTEGLKSDQPKTRFPSLRERITTPAHSSKTHSIKQLAGQLVEKAADKLVPDRVKQGASTLKAKAGKKAQAALELVTEKAMALKSKTIGKLLRMIRSENFSKVDSGATGQQPLKDKIAEHNSDVDKLADLKTQLKNEETGLKEFRSEYKDALKLLEHPEKFIESSKPTTITIPGGESRTINAGDTATRREMVDMIKGDIMETPEYQNYEQKMAQKANGGTELYRERQTLKSDMKMRAENMVEMFQQEVAEDLEASKGSVEARREAFTTEHRDKISERGAQYQRRTEDAREDLEAKRKKVDDLKSERQSTREVLSQTRKEKSEFKEDVGVLAEGLSRAKSGRAKQLASESVQGTKKSYDHHKEATGKMKERLGDIQEEISKSRKQKKEARKAFEDLESGKARKKDIKQAAKEWETEEAKFDKEVKQLDKQAKKKTNSFKKGLG